MPLSVAFLKRLMDVTISLIVLTVLSPVFIIIGFLIWKEDRGPVFYTQKRVGISRSPFNIIKFRTMIPDAEKHTGAVLQVTNDSRITKIGYFLRKTRLDELPNFFNVLLGQMSVVGPRAERAEIYQKYEKQFPLVWDRTRYVKPGITGSAQISLMSNGSLDENCDFVHALPEIDHNAPEDVVRFKMYYDFAYVIQVSSFWSFLIADLSIMLKTPYVMFFNRNVV